MLSGGTCVALQPHLMLGWLKPTTALSVPVLPQRARPSLCPLNSSQQASSTPLAQVTAKHEEILHSWTFKWDHALVWNDTWKPVSTKWKVHYLQNLIFLLESRLYYSYLNKSTHKDITPHWPIYALLNFVGEKTSRELKKVEFCSVLATRKLEE